MHLRQFNFREKKNGKLLKRCGMFSRNPEVDPHEKMGTATEKWLVRESHLSKSSVLLISALFCLCTFSKLKVSHST